jgi:SAM-dependent methyltransferase
MQKARSIEDYYNGDYNLDSDISPVFIYREKAYKFFKGFNKKNKSLKLLDIGCDDGVFSSSFMALGYDVSGIDIRKKEVILAKKRGIKAVVGNAEHRFPFNNNAFDAAYSGDIIEHLYDTDYFLSEVSRVLKPGALFVVTTPNLASLSNRIRLLLGKLPIGSEIRLGQDMAGHIRNYTFPALEQQLRKHNFSIARKVSSNQMFPAKFRIPILRNIAIKLGDYLPNIGSHIIIAAKKR